MTKPNVVFILADDMGYGDFSCFNGNRSQTPNLDSLVSEGVCFSQHYSSSPVCNPSRASLLTGRYPHRTGSIDTLEWRGLERLALDETTLAQMLQANGYRTGLVGKWHLGSYDLRYLPQNRGFDEAVYFAGGMHDYFDWRIAYNGDYTNQDGRYLTDVWTEEALAFIKRHHNHPFFLHVTYNAPHTPLQALQEDISRFSTNPELTKGVQTLYGMLYRMDEGIGRIRETLKTYGIEDNTLFIFTSDNGPHFGGVDEWCLKRYNCGFNGSKTLVYEGGIRVPLVMQFNDGINQTSEIQDIVHFCDWFPTLLSMVGVLIPNHIHLDGVDVSGLLQGTGCDLPDQRCWQWNRFDPLVTCNAAIREGDWKLVRPQIKEAMGFTEHHWLEKSMAEPDYFWEHGLVTDPYFIWDFQTIPEPELYNIKEDPLENHNCAAKHPQLARRLLYDLERWFEEVETERARLK
jgi:arylsulfatase A-like enzyme